MAKIVNNSSIMVQISPTELVELIKENHIEHWLALDDKGGIDFTGSMLENIFLQGGEIIFEIRPFQVDNSARTRYNVYTLTKRENIMKTNFKLSIMKRLANDPLNPDWSRLLPSKLASELKNVKAGQN